MFIGIEIFTRISTHIKEDEDGKFIIRETNNG